MWGEPPTGNGGWGVFARQDERKRITDMTTTEVQTPMNTTAQPDPYAPFVGARVVAGLIDLALVVAAVAPLALIDLGIAAVAGFVLAAAYSTILEGGPSGQTFGKRWAGVRVVDVRTGGSIGRLRALLRHFGRLPFVGPGFLLVMLLLPGGQTWYDWALRSDVVPAEGSH